MSRLAFGLLVAALLTAISSTAATAAPARLPAGGTTSLTVNVPVSALRGNNGPQIASAAAAAVKHHAAVDTSSASPSSAAVRVRTEPSGRVRVESM